MGHFKKDLLNDKNIQRVVFRTKQNLNLYYGDNDVIQPYYSIEDNGGALDSMLGAVNAKWTNDADFGGANVGKSTIEVPFGTPAPAPTVQANAVNRVLEAKKE